MEDFFKEIKGNLEGRPEPPFTETAWKGMEKKLDGQSEKRRLVLGWWWLALPLLGLSLLSNALVFNELQKSNSKIARLEIRQDTVFLTKVIYRTDTIYQTRVVRKTVREYLPAVFAAADFGLPSQAGGTKSPTIGDKANLGLVSNDLSPEGGQSVPNQLTVDSMGAAAIGVEQELEALKTLGFRRLRQRGKLPQVAAVLSLPVAHKPTLDRSAIEVLKHPQVGLNVGLNQPFAEGLDGNAGASGSLQLAFPISPRWWLWGEVSKEKVSYESNRIGDDIGIPFLASSLPNFLFDNAEVNKKSRQLSVGFQHHFLKAGRLRPYFGLGFLLEDVQPYQVSYDFRNEDTGLEFTDTLAISGDGPAHQYLVLRAGMGQKLYKNWHWNVQAGYEKQLKTMGLGSPQLLNFSAGLRYHF